MRVTIIRDDNMVIVDGVARTVSCASLQASFHALQWDGVRGEIEYAALRCEHCGVRSKKGNETITDLAPFQPYIALWQVEDARVKMEEAAAAQEAQANVARPES